MQDRVSTYPNRWKLTPVAGQTNVYDFERADEPVVAGTPLNKATFLTNEAAAAIAALAGSTPTLPTEALAAIASVIQDMDAGTIAHVEYGSYAGTGTSGAANPTSLTFTYKPRLVIINRGTPSKSTWYMTGGTNSEYALYIYPRGGTYTLDAETNTYLYINVTDNTLTWYYTSDAGTPTNRAQDQKNGSGRTYYYVALTVE